MLKRDGYHPFATPCSDLLRYFVSPQKKAIGLNLLYLIYRTFLRKAITVSIFFEVVEASGGSFEVFLNKNRIPWLLIPKDPEC